MRPQRIPRTPQEAAQHTLGSAVRELRACRVISQEELGHRARLHRNYIGALERGEINPTFKTLRMLAEGLDVELSSLIRLYEERQEDHHEPASRVIRQPVRGSLSGTAPRPPIESRDERVGPTPPSTKTDI